MKTEEATIRQESRNKSFLYGLFNNRLRFLREKVKLGIATVYRPGRFSPSGESCRCFLTLMPSHVAFSDARRSGRSGPRASLRGR
jgi:hypothetical protein